MLSHYRQAVRRRVHGDAHQFVLGVITEDGRCAVDHAGDEIAGQVIDVAVAGICDADNDVGQLVRQVN